MRSATLSGWPIVTDSLVNRRVSLSQLGLLRLAILTMYLHPLNGSLIAASFASEANPPYHRRSGPAVKVKKAGAWDWGCSRGPRQGTMNRLWHP